MSKKNKQPAPLPPPRASQDITQEYTNLCAEVGNALFQFEITKSQAFAKYQQLHAEMQRAVEKEQAEDEKLKAETERMQADLKAKGENLIQLMANEAVK